NQKYGQNKSLLKRDMGKLVSQYDTHDWDVKVNDMDRQVTVSLGANGGVQYKGHGKYLFPVPKNWRGGDRNGTTLSYNFVEAIGAGAVGQYNVKVNLPADAKDIKLDDTNDSGERAVSYVVASDVASSGKKTAMFASGGALLVLGVL